MRSKTKFEVSEAMIVELFEKAGIAGAKNVSPLGAGEFNSVFAVDAGGEEYAIKIAPDEFAPVLSHERGMMAQEVYYYGLMRDEAKIRVPAVFYADFSKKEIPTEFFIMERLKGKQIDQVDFQDGQREEADRQLTGMMAKMHTVKGTEFGYRQRGLHVSWFLALESMVGELIEDCKRMGRKTRRGERLLGHIRANRAVLEKVDCSLINFDIWSANIFCDVRDDGIELAWIDPERCMWGDRIADFVCLDFMNMSLDSKKKFVDYYNEATDEPIVIGDEERIRLAIMLGYLGVIMDVEKYARYGLLNYGYWRNVQTCRMLFGSCFKQLESFAAKKKI